jgi:flagellar biosynthesis protein FlhB
MAKEHDQTEEATPHRRSEARDRGQVAKSIDLVHAIMVSGFVAVVAVGLPSTALSLALTCQDLFGMSATAPWDSDGPLRALSRLATELIAALSPMLLAAVLLAIIANVAQTGPVFSAHPLKADPSRLNPIVGFQKLFTKRMLIELPKTLVKFAALTGVAAAFLWTAWPSLATLQNATVPFQAQWLAGISRGLAWRLAAVLGVIGLLDLAFTRWNFSRELRMSRREIKEELRRREGDPHVRHRIRELQRENLKQTRSISRVGDADVLITNPEHIAVALLYDRKTMAAPHILAIGKDLWAAEMKLLARQRSIPIQENRPLARLLCARGAPDRPIPAEAYVQVARVYAGIRVERPAREASAIEVSADGEVRSC